jgi:hypothetical protein
MTTSHATERAVERLADAGIDPKVVLNEADRIAAAYHAYSLAVRMRTLNMIHGDTKAAFMERESNGDEVWAICRGGTVRTIMLRRSTQPKTPAAFGVDRVARIEGK